MQQEVKILILGKGGRESALAGALLRSSRCSVLYADVPLCSHPKLKQTRLDPMDFESVGDFCRANAIDLLLVGPPEPIVAGIRDALSARDDLEALRIVAPTAEAARLEGSKEYAKEFMAEYGIPSPRFMPVDEDTLGEGLAFLDSICPPYVIKADGLADGRGVVILHDLGEAKNVLEDMVTGNNIGRNALIEEYVCGDECTVVIATDGEDYCLLPPARDYKRLLDGDNGPNTPGMGGYSPVAFADGDFMGKVEKRIISPTLSALRQRGIDYQGFLYFGLMNIDGEPILLEYNARLGDPETQVIMPLIKSDFVDVLEGIVDRTAGIKRIETTDLYSVAVVLATLTEEMEVEGIGNAEAEGASIFSGKTLRVEPDGTAVCTAGRILTVEALGANLEEARGKCCDAASKIDTGKIFYRRDIAEKDTD